MVTREFIPTPKVLYALLINGKKIQSMPIIGYNVTKYQDDSTMTVLPMTIDEQGKIKALSVFGKCIYTTANNLEGISIRLDEISRGQAGGNL